jgi:hypothetical protein
VPTALSAGHAGRPRAGCTTTHHACSPALWPARPRPRPPSTSKPTIHPRVRPPTQARQSHPCWSADTSASPARHACARYRACLALLPVVVSTRPQRVPARKHALSVLALALAGPPAAEPALVICAWVPVRQRARAQLPPIIAPSARRARDCHCPRHRRCSRMRLHWQSCPSACRRSMKGRCLHQRDQPCTNHTRVPRPAHCYGNGCIAQHYVLREGPRARSVACCGRQSVALALGGLWTAAVLLRPRPPGSARQGLGRAHTL